MSETAIEVGIVGLREHEGWAQRAHLPALRALEGYEVTGVANSHAASAERAARHFGLQPFPDAGALARDGSVDLVTVTVKVPHHREPVMAALEASKMVYCEWPLGNGLEEATVLAEAARRAGVRTLIGLQARSSPVVRHVRELVRDGYVGEVLSTTLVGSGGLWGASVDERDAYTHDGANGATLLTIPFGHTIDALAWCLGPVERVSATGATRRTSYTVSETGEARPMRTEDQVALTGRLAGGAVVVAHYRGGTSRGTNLRWEINGTDGDLEVTAPTGHLQLTQATLRGARGEDRTLQPLPTPERLAFAPPDLEGGAVNVAEAYVQFARGADAPFPVPSFEDAVEVHRLLDAVERSWRTGEAVMV